MRLVALLLLTYVVQTSGLAHKSAFRRRSAAAYAALIATREARVAKLGKARPTLAPTSLPPSEHEWRHPDVAVNPVDAATDEIVEDIFKICEDIKEHSSSTVIAPAPSVEVARPAPTFADPPPPSLRRCLAFALPALGIYVAPPLLSLIDAGIVGRDSSLHLAALGPASTISDSAPNLLLFLSIACLSGWSE